jgi:hypothetical protein
MSSSGGTLLGHPVLAGARGAADQLALAGHGRAWQLGDGDVEAALAALVQVEARATALRAVLLAEAESRNLKERTQGCSVPDRPGRGAEPGRADQSRPGAGRSPHHHTGRGRPGRRRRRPTSTTPSKPPRGSPRPTG